MTAHTHDDNVLTIGCPGCIDRLYVATPSLSDYKGSLGARRTQANNEAIAAGVHPATGRDLIDGHTCGECAHHNAVTHYTSRVKTWHKCDKHRLGQSHSDASDIRVSWPACTLYEASESASAPGDAQDDREKVES